MNLTQAGHEKLINIMVDTQTYVWFIIYRRRC